MSHDDEQRVWHSFSPLRTLLLLVVIGIAGYSIYTNRIGAERERLRKARGEVTASIFRMVPPTPANLQDTYQDSDRDMVADGPLSAESVLDLDTLNFSYLAGEMIEIAPESWESLLEEIEQETGIPTEYTQLPTFQQQLDALRTGKLQITAFNTGSVTSAVNSGGFVPVSALTRGDGTQGYSAKIITYAGSGVTSPAGLKSLMFTSPRSHSGFRFPLLMLAKDFDLLPDRDYEYRFSQSHEASIRSVIAHDVEAAAVASDVLKLIVDQDQVSPDQLVTIHESAHFPAACFGYHHGIDPHVARSIRAVLDDFSFAGTPLAEAFQPSGFVGLAPIDFKQDFSEIRLIEAVLSGDTMTLLSN